MDIDEIISKIKELGYDAKYIKEEVEEGRMVDIDIPQNLKSIYYSLGIDKFYEFQKEAIDYIDRNENVIIIAPTASGKTEAFLYAALKNFYNKKTTLIVYPTKALSRDQLKRFSSLLLYGIRAEIYDGDTPQGRREKIRNNPPPILITNFDMLHFILLNHKKFSSFFENLETVIIDEFHIYTGVFGSHVGNIIRRLKRVLRKVYSKDVQFVLSSATVGNAEEFASSIIQEDFKPVYGKGRGKTIHHLIVRTLDSYITATVRIASLLSQFNLKTLIFANSHSSVERLGLIARNMNLNLKVYRAGFTKKEREKLEHEFKLSPNAILASTSALELGIDIGNVSSVLLAGFAGTITSAKQRLGRAGRKGEGIAIFVARENPLDVYYAEHPELYIFKEAENCYANPSNPYVLKTHILAMAKESLINEEEASKFKPYIDELLENGLLQKFSSFYSITREGAIMARKLSIRGIDENISIINSETEKPIGTRAKPFAITELYEGAIYLHGGRFFISEKLDLDENKAYVSSYEGERNIYTKALSDKTAEILEKFDSKEFGNLELSIGRVRISTQVYGFLVKDIYSNTTLGEHTFSSPYLYEMESNAIWLDFNEFPQTTNFGDGLHGFEHVSIAMSPILTGSDDRELGGISYSDGRMFIYEGIPGGIGLVDILYKNFPKLAVYTRQRLYECDCEDGCPKCILDPMCGNDNRYLSKSDAKNIASFVLENVK